MKQGSKSLLFGVHQFLWHPVTVYLAWCHLYGLPNVRTMMCIFVHDLGYWGRGDMDGAEGVFHTEKGACMMLPFGREYAELCLYHSRTYAKAWHVQPSRLCWADKLSICYDPAPFYLFRARLSGELEEYRAEAAQSGICPKDASDEEWLRCVRSILRQQALQHRKDK